MFSELGSILMLHRIAPYEKGKIVYNEDMKVSPEELRSVIIQLKSMDRIFVSLDEVVNFSENKKKSKYKFIAFTIDDGYKDNLEYAYPIFKEFSIPFCIYVTNSFPNRTTNLWWYALEELILKNKTLVLNGTKRDNKNVERKNENFLLLREETLTKHFLNPLSYLQEAGRLEFNLYEEINEKCLTWDEIISLNADPLVTIGAHTVNHYPLSKLTEQEASHELRSSKEELEQRLKNPVRHLAFPFGTIKEAFKREYRLAENLTFHTAVTTVDGHMYKHDNLLRLNRIFLRPLQKNSITLREMMNKKLAHHVKHIVKSLIN